MSTLEEKSARGAKATALLEDPIFREAVETVQAHIFDDFAKTDPADTGALQRRRIELQALAEVVRQIKSVIDTGKIAAAEIQRESLAQRTKRRFGIR